MFETQLDKHIHMIYDTVADSATWHECLTEIAGAVGLEPNDLLTVDKGLTVTNRLLETVSKQVNGSYLIKLVPHIKRALAMKQKLEADQFSIRLNQTVQSSLGQLSLVVGADRKIVPTNSDLNALLDKSKLVTVQGNELKSIEGISIRDLNQAIDTAISNAEVQQDLSPSAFLVHQKKNTEERVWLVEVCRFERPQNTTHHPLFSNTSKNLAQISLRELSRKDDALAYRLASLFHLSQSELDVAILIAKGVSPNDIAKSRSRSIDTVRTQIKQITAKMGVKKATELIILINNISLR